MSAIRWLRSTIPVGVHVWHTLWSLSLGLGAVKGTFQEFGSSERVSNPVLCVLPSLPRQGFASCRLGCDVWRHTPIQWKALIRHPGVGASNYCWSGTFLSLCRKPKNGCYFAEMVALTIVGPRRILRLG